MEALFEKAGNYLETRLDLFKLKATQQSSGIMSSMISSMILVLIITNIVLMINIGLALLLGEMLGKSYYGFFLLGGVYCLAGLIFHLNKNKWVEEPVTNAIIKKMIN